MMALHVVLNSIRAGVLNHLTHDVRTPLSSAKLSLNLIERDLSQKVVNLEKIAKNCAIALRNIDYANDLIEEMLNSENFRTKMTKTVPRYDRVDIAEIISNTISTMSTLTTNRIEFIGNSVLGYWDAKNFRRVLENLISNAIKYGEEDTPISVKVISSNGRLLLSVHNRGPSIPVEKREIIFSSRERLGKTKEIKGWGLGLTFCKKVAEEHAGSIAIESSDENGTTFTIDVPIDPRGIEISNH
jgi:signal transduction histidine kinase